MFGTVSGAEWNQYFRLISALPAGVDPGTIPNPYATRAARDPVTPRAQTGTTNTDHHARPSLHVSGRTPCTAGTAGLAPPQSTSQS
ncbi:hypothetical protein MMC28_003280, partial [Mycoblastus sanguinarius]|nr:hypothetical protein [Mycoblastus sanguinarius]